MNEIGDKLKEARQSQGYTLDDLQQMTKIQKRYLIAVEEGNLDVLPGNFYARAFIKQYADSVGLNGEELIKEHMDSLPQVSETTYSKGVDSKQTRSKNKSSGFLATIQDSLPTILIVLLVIAIIFAIYLAVTFGGGNADSDSFIQGDDASEIVEVDDNGEESDEEADTDDEYTEDQASDSEDIDNDESEDDDSEEDESAEQTVEESGGTGNSTVYTIQGDHPTEQVLTLSAEGGSSWVSIEVDGTMTEQGLIDDGQSLSVDFDDTVSEIALVIGNASATLVELNDMELPAAVEAVRQEMYISFE
ncbi:helix-turn-helix domain-containing protein [Alkalibacterium psychrotolerans]